jgi:hypothetical protein
MGGTVRALFVIRCSGQAVDVQTVAVGLPKPPDTVPVYCWCDWCQEQWEANGLVTDGWVDAVWETNDHNYRCERGGRYVGVAATPAERTQRQGDEFPGLP